MEIKVCGVEYQVLQKEVVESDSNCWGVTNYERSSIELKRTLSPDKKKQTLIHELIHAMLHEAGFAEHDEDLVNRLGIVLFDVLKTNKLKATLKKLE